MRRKTTSLLLCIAAVTGLSGCATKPTTPQPSAPAATWVHLPPSPPPPPPPPPPYPAWLAPLPGEHDIVLVSKTPPAYPKNAMKHGHQGTTIVRLVINSEGQIVAVSVGKSSGFPELDQAAVDAAWHWTFRPGWLRGAAVGGVVEVPVGFALSVVKPRRPSSTKQARK